MWLLVFSCVKELFLLVLLVFDCVAWMKGIFLARGGFPHKLAVYMCDNSLNHAQRLDCNFSDSACEYGVLTSASGESVCVYMHVCKPYKCMFLLQSS